MKLKPHPTSLAAKYDLKLASTESSKFSFSKKGFYKGSKHKKGKE